MSDRAGRPTTIAYYLPQFYPIPENDAWYGTGFTEWRNVVRARPLFEGHEQPRLPADLGFYDLRVREVRHQQARLAKRYGIDAFCYYHYWFNGVRPLRHVIDDVLANSVPNMPFCLAWANENWSRHWDASQHEVLLRQTYTPEDDEEHGQFLLRVMSHPLYLRVDGRPILFIYRIQAFPDATATIERWRRMWAEGGLPDVHIVKFDTHGDFNDPAVYGADTAAQFLPHGIHDVVRPIRPDGCHPDNQVFSYEQVSAAYRKQPQPGWTRHECVLPSWDNTSRRGDGKSLLVHGSTPELYEEWLSTVHKRAGADGLVLINAWNEWAEGAYLEPDLTHGHAYLEATARAIGQPVPPQPGWSDPTPTAVEDDQTDLAERYLEACEAVALLRRRLSRLEATLERQISLAVQNHQAELRTARQHALELAAELERLEGTQRTFTSELPGAPASTANGVHRT
ncbi:MAG TPA: glycoside hydrolase family 99-like domain-containing protein [Sporichthya sp.]|nr:glycoside hydrolase family 99-like domain-containing protein [Sporichthya sp.]